MKISYRILIINFAIVVLILASSAIAFYSIVYNVLTSQQSKYLLNSANEFIYSYRGSILDIEDEFLSLTKKNPESIFNYDLNSSKNIDFAFEVAGKNDGTIVKKNFSQNLSRLNSISTLQEFINYNPYSVTKKVKLARGRILYYGKILNSGFLNSISKKINAEVAIISSGTPAIISNESVNQIYSYALSRAARNLSSQNNFDIFTDQTSSSDILATIYKPAPEFNQSSNFQFLVFTALNEAADLRKNLKYILIIIGSAGVALSLILSLVFTDKLRKQIRRLSLATNVTKEGNFQNKIEIQSKDELGELAIAFNTMLDELQKKEKAKNEYSDFITLLNQNPTLFEVSSAALRKIIFTCGFTVGALYSVENNEIKLLSSYGLEINHNKNYSELFKSLITNNETVEINSNEDLPVVSAGVVDLKIRYMMFVPIIYNSKVISILELGSFDKPSGEVKDYLSKIKDQLAIGLTNASAFVQLENLVSELKQLNDEYQKQNIQIRKQNETLVELHNKLKEKADELAVQKQKAEEATRLKSQFLASMSHELRTPMNSVLGLTELILEDKTLNNKNRERIEVVLKSGKRLMGLINGILDLSKIEAGKMTIYNEEIIVEDLIREAESAIIPLVEKRDLSFSVVRKTNTRAVIKTDRGKVTQILINLLDNAIKFTDSGSVELHISVDEKNFLKFEVVDSGIGISEEFQKIIFDEFRQIDGTTTRKYSGTGLGLAICKKLSNMLQGSLSVKSKSGYGSTFTLAIPFNYVGIRESDREAGINSVPANNLRKSVLIFEENEKVGLLLKQYLNSKGYSISSAELTDGLGKAVKMQPFAIIIDVISVKNDAWELVKELKENSVTCRIPLVLVSVLGYNNFAYNLGALDYVMKPVSSLELGSLLKRSENISHKNIESVIFISDNEVYHKLLNGKLNNKNIKIDYIKNDDLAFDKIQKIQPDLVIMDLAMSGSSGIDLSYKLRSNIETRHLPIIFELDKTLSLEKKKDLNNAVKEVTLKSQGNTTDVYRSVRDRLNLFEAGAAKDEKTVPVVNKEETTKIIMAADEDNRRGTVLIVDDDEDSLYTLNEIVQACECNTLLAKSGIECLNILENKIPELILLDIMMPEMDGFQTFNKIKANPVLSNIPIYAITAKAMLEDKQVIIKYGFDDYIAKPVNTGVLAFKIERLFSKLKLI